MSAKAAEVEDQIEVLVRQFTPPLLKVLGVGPIVGARVVVSWSHPGRFRSEAAFAKLGRVAPTEASSGMVVRHRLNRRYRQLNRALHTAVLVRMRQDPASEAYDVARRLRTLPAGLDRARKRAIVDVCFTTPTLAKDIRIAVGGHRSAPPCARKVLVETLPRQFDELSSLAPIVMHRAGEIAPADQLRTPRWSLRLRVGPVRLPPANRIVGGTPIHGFPTAHFLAPPTTHTLK